MKLKFKVIQLFEPIKWWKFRIGWRLTKEKIDWEKDELKLLQWMISKEKKIKRKPAYFSDIKRAMMQSHHNQSEAFMARYPSTEVLDIENIIK